MNVTADTNLLIYSQDSADPVKQASSRRILQIIGDLEGRCIALQVVGEFFNAATRKLKIPRSIAANLGGGILAQFPCFGYGVDEVELALSSAANGVFSYWDGLLFASAVSAGCNLLISEDMQDGFRFEQLSVIAPFAPDGTPNPELMERLAA